MMLTTIKTMAVRLLPVRTRVKNPAAIFPTSGGATMTHTHHSISSDCGHAPRETAWAQKGHKWPQTIRTMQTGCHLSCCGVCIIRSTHQQHEDAHVGHEGSVRLGGSVEAPVPPHPRDRDGHDHHEECEEEVRDGDLGGLDRHQDRDGEPVLRQGEREGVRDGRDGRGTGLVAQCTGGGLTKTKQATPPIQLT